MANHMAEVAKILGVELGEIFEIKENPGTVYKFDKNFERLLYFIDDSWWQARSDTIEGLIYGYNTIKRKPWKPKIGENYWVIVPDGDISEYAWLDSLDDNSNYKLGNCYRTREEAEANRDKWVAFYASDEVLEV